MLISKALITVENPSRYINRLCKHWSHKFTIEQTEQHSSIDFGTAHCTLTHADDQLTLKLSSASAAELEKMQQVVANHLIRMSSKHISDVSWDS